MAGGSAAGGPREETAAQGRRRGTGAPGGRVQHQGGTQAGRVHRGRATAAQGLE
jgi:hypothetical protein